MGGDFGRDRATTRRQVLAGAGALASTMLLGGGSALAALPPGDFLLASSRLCGIELDGSYLETAAAVWTAVSAELGEDRLRRVSDLAAQLADIDVLKAELKAQGLEGVARGLIYAWYNGWINRGGQIDEVVEPRSIGTQTADDQALMWRACQDWAKAPGDCGGPFGYWHNEPNAGGAP